MKIIDFVTEYKDNSFLDCIFNNKRDTILETKTQLHLTEEEELYYDPKPLPELKYLVDKWFEYYKNILRVENPVLDEEYYIYNLKKEYIVIKYLDDSGYVFFEEPIYIRDILNKVNYICDKDPNSSKIRECFNIVSKLFILNYNVEPIIVFTRGYSIINTVNNPLIMDNFNSNLFKEYDLLCKENKYPEIMAFVINPNNMDFISSKHILLIQPFYNSKNLIKYKISKSFGELNSNFNNLVQHWIQNCLNNNSILNN